MEEPAQYHLPLETHPKSTFTKLKEYMVASKIPFGSVFIAFLHISVFTPKHAFTQESPFMADFKSYQIVPI